MSDRDTDDTDVLLNSDPSGGLNMFLGLSLKELSEKHKNILTTPTPPEAANNGPSTSSQKTDAEPSNNDLKNLELDNSDFYNSQGELVLSGLSEWTATDTDSNPDSQSENEDADSLAGSEASFTYEPVANGELDNIDVDPNNGTEQKIENNNKQTDTPTSAACNQDNRKHLHEQALVVTNQHLNQTCDDDDDTIEEIDTANFTNNNVGYQSTQSFIPQFLNHGRVFDVNLLRPSAGWNIPLPTTVPGQEGEQIFTRAPNFRTPGGYKPPKNPKASRDLTEEQISEEVKKMYEFPDELTAEFDDLKVEDNHCNSIFPPLHTPKVLRFAEEVEKDLENQENFDQSRRSTKNKKSNRKVEFDFVNGINEPVVFGASTTTSNDGANPGKRKHLVQMKVKKHEGSGDYEDVSPLKVGFCEDPVVTQSQTIPSSVTELPYSTKVVRGKRGNKKKSSNNTSSSKNKFSFGYGESSDGDLSPIKGFGGAQVYHTPQSSNKDTDDTSSETMSMGLDDLKSIWKEIQSRRQILIGEGRPGMMNENDSSIVDLGAVSDSEPEIINIPEQSLPNQRINDSSFASSSISSKSSVRQGGYSVDMQQKFVPMLESFASDLETILQEAEINPEDFEDIIDGLGTGGDVGGGIQDLLNEIQIHDGDDGPDGSVEGELSDWAKSGAVEFVEKYHEEKFKRQECESEIQKLQKELMDIKQRNAVLEGKMKKKDLVVNQISTSWRKITKELKQYEITSKEEIEKLLKEQKELIAACDENKEKITNYEKELIKTLELADSFKSKIIELQNEKLAAASNFEKEKQSMKETIQKLEKDLKEMSDEKITALRALKESQIQIDNHNVIQNKLEAQLTSLEAQNSENLKKISHLMEQKETLETEVESLTRQRNEMSNQIKSFTEDIQKAAKEKEEMLQEFGSATDRQVKEEGERLHEYYNKKVQEVLKSATEKAANAEATLVKKMRKANLETERKLNECRERHQLEILTLKANYKSEIQALKKDNLQKQLLIKTTAQQLQCGELVRSGEVDRLQSIVSSFSSSRRHSSDREGGDVGGGSDCETLRSMKKLNMQYNKFTQNLDLNSEPNINHSSSIRPEIFHSNDLLRTTGISSTDSVIPAAPRYNNKTSTPIISTVDNVATDMCNLTKNDVISKASQLCKYFETSNHHKPNRTHLDSDSLLLKTSVGSVKGQKSVKKCASSSNSYGTQTVNSVEPITELAEIPVRLQTEKIVDSHLDEASSIDPEFQKCLEQLIKSYAQKIDLSHTQTSSLLKSCASDSTTSRIPDNDNEPSCHSVSSSSGPNRIIQVHSDCQTENPDFLSASTSITQTMNDIDSSSNNKPGNSNKDKIATVKDKDKTLGNNISGGSKRPWK